MNKLLDEKETKKLEHAIEQLQKCTEELKRDNDLAELKSLDECLYELVLAEEIHHCKNCDSFVHTNNGLPEDGCWACFRDDYHEAVLDLSAREKELIIDLI